MKTMTFALRSIKEILRDPLSYIFCLGFPIMMLVTMTILDRSIPDVPQKPIIFHIGTLTPAIAIFGLTFIMLFSCIQVSKDRAGAFLIRLYVSPMKSSDFIFGYTISFGVIALIQILITYLCGEIISLMLGSSLNILNILISFLILLPSIILFIGIGLIFGTLCNDKAAPGVTSIFITLAGMFGGIWMDVESLSDGLKNFCLSMPFYHSVKSARIALNGDFSNIFQPLLICLLYGIVIYIIAVIIFSLKMKSDKK